MGSDHISNQEILYRSVRSKDNSEYFYNEDNQLIITRAAFSDKIKQPSVDRAELRDFTPSLSKLNESDGIVSLITGDVRAIGSIETPHEEASNVKHAVEVVYSPRQENNAHSHVTVEPSFFGSDKKQKKAFKLLRIALARLATNSGWLLEPQT